MTGALSTQPSVREAIAKTIEESHGGKLEPKQAKAMLAIQQQRDRAWLKACLLHRRPRCLSLADIMLTERWVYRFMSKILRL